MIVLSPEYNHSFSAPIKAVIDAMPKSAWRAKPVGFVSYGGFSAGLRAVEQLRLVFAELHAVTMRDVVSYYLMNQNFDEQGDPTGPMALTEPLGYFQPAGLVGASPERCKGMRPYGQPVLV